MDLIYEKSKTSKRKDDLAILYRMIRSSKSCCITYYIDICYEYGFRPHKY